MKSTGRATVLLTHDLEVRSKGSPGRRLFERLECSDLDLLGVSSPLEFALRLRGDDACARDVLEGLLEWVEREDGLVLVAMGALAPRLDLTAARLARGVPGDDATSEVLGHAVVAVRRAHEQAAGERVSFVLTEALYQARSVRRRQARHNVPFDRLSPEFDRAEVEWPGDGTDCLARAIQSQVISVEELGIVAGTRSGRYALADVAEETGVSYDALRMRRARIEVRLRRFYEGEPRR